MYGLGKVPVLTKKDVKVLEAILKWSVYKEAAKSVKMDSATFYTYLSRIRRKHKRAKKFLRRMRKYETALYKREEEE